MDFIKEVTRKEFDSSIIKEGTPIQLFYRPDQSTINGLVKKNLGDSLIYIAVQRSHVVEYELSIDDINSVVKIKILE